MCFSEPFPDYEFLVTADYGTAELDRFSRDRRSPDAQRNAWTKTGFRFFFRNIDALRREVFSPDTDAMEHLPEHFRARRIEFQELSFENDFPESHTPVDRESKDIHFIWEEG